MTIRYDGGAIGVHKGDTIRNFTGSAGYVYRQNEGGNSGVISFQIFGSTPAKAGIIGGDSGDSVSIQINASNQVPTASENRPASISLFICVSY